MDFNALANAHDAFNLPQIVILNDTLKAPESGWNTVLTDWVKAIGIGSLITGVMMFCVARGQLKISKYQHVLGRNQLKLTRAQFRLAEEQANVSKEQKEIAKQKLKLELFELRYDCYKSFKDNYSDFTSGIVLKDSDFLLEKRDKCNSINDEIKILFPLDIYISSLEILKIMMEIIGQKWKYERREIKFEEFKKETSRMHENLVDAFIKDFQKKIDSFMNFKGIDVF